MSRPPRIMIVLACCAAAASAMAIGCGGSEPASEPSQVSARDQARGQDAGHDRRQPKLSLPSRGHPFVAVRIDRRLEIHAEPGGATVKTVDARTEFGSRTVFSVVRRQGRWAAVLTPFLANGEPGWVRLDPKLLRAGATRTSVAVDLSRRSAELVEDGRVVRSFTVTVGMPGAETPSGRFAVTDTFRGDLDPAYGCCALALNARQTQVPSGWIGGDRIAIHGTSGPLGIAASHGCVRAADADVSALVDRVPLGAPVTITG